MDDTYHRPGRIGTNRNIWDKEKRARVRFPNSRCLSRLTLDDGIKNLFYLGVVPFKPPHAVEFPTKLPPVLTEGNYRVVLTNSLL